MDRLSNQSHTERGANAAHGIESRGVNPRCLGDLRHAAGAGDVS
jgi:hypothetical protein